MPQWIDLKHHDVALLVRKNAAGLNELVPKQLRPDAVVPPAALAYGFEPEGEIYVRRETRFNLQEMRQIYPQAVVAELSMEDIVYRAVSSVVELRPGDATNSTERASETTPVVATEAAAPEEVPFTSNLWAYIPLPRFRQEARVVEADGQHWVAHGDLRYPVDRPRKDEVAIAHVHRKVAENAIKAGERLPFAVLVDYPDLAYFGAHRAHSSTRVTKLLSRLGIAERLMQGESGYARLSNDPYMDLVVERRPYSEGDRLFLTHYREQNGDQILDAEMVFTIRDGRLFLKETAVENVLRGGELRGYDHYFANVFSRNLLEQGFDEAQVFWPNDPQPAPARGEAVEPAPAEPAPVLAQIPDGPNQGLVLAIGTNSAGEPALAVGAHRAAAAAALEDRVSPETGMLRQIGENLMGQLVYEDDHGRRQLRFGESPLLQTDSERGLEFMTKEEGKRAGQLTFVQGLPVPGARLFGKGVFRTLDGEYYAIEHRGADEHHGAEVYGFRLEKAEDAAPRWISLGAPWTQGAPSDNELRSASTRSKPAAFDQAAFIAGINDGIPATNADMISEKHHVQPIDSEQILIEPQGGDAFEVRLADPLIPADPVKIKRDGAFWRASVGTSSAHSLQGPLETVVLWANRELANAKRYYQSHLHRAIDGNLHIGVPREQLVALSKLMTEKNLGRPIQWSDMGITDTKTPPAAFDIRKLDLERGRMTFVAEGTQRRYELFALELNPSASLGAYEKQGVLSVREWLFQVDNDIAWEETVRTHPSGSLLDERVRQYLDYQVKHFGTRFEARVPSQAARGIVLAITDRDVDHLLSVLAPSAVRNPSTAKLFQDISGKMLGTNKQSREAAIYAHCGYSPDAAAEHRAQRESRKRVKMLEAEAKQTIARCENYQIRHNGSVISGKQFIDARFEEGYTELITRKRGSVTRYGLINPSTGSYYDLQEPLTSYVRHVLTIRTSAQPTPAPELEDKLVPTV